MDKNQQLQDIERRLNDIESLVFNSQTYQVFDKIILSKNKIQVEKRGIKFRSDSNPTGFEIRTGSSTTDAGIKAEVGTLPKGSIFVSSNGVGEIWVMQTSTWTKLTLP